MHVVGKKLNIAACVQTKAGVTSVGFATHRHTRVHELLACANFITKVTFRILTKVNCGLRKWEGYKGAEW
jgi:hypothetical protein